LRNIRRALALAVLGLALPISAFAAPAAATMKVVLHSPIKEMGFQRVMASATVRQTKADAFVNFTAEHLPSPHVLHAMAYILWATDGGMKEKVGLVKVNKSNMAGLKGEVMMTKVQDLVVTAENSTTVTKPHGKVVLSGMVG
jgi:hypothetical protein